MSSVYEARDGAGQRVALKLLHPAVAADPTSRDRLRREVSMLQRVQGPYVASILDAETEDSDVFIVTELVDGPTLERDVYDSGTYDGSDLIELGEELGLALRSIHEVGVLHRDLKPSNVMMGPDGPVLIDFGIAQLGDDLRLTEQGSLAHTPGWADPRIIRGDDPDELADWWSMAAVLAFSAVGRPPFGTGNAQAVMNRVLEGNADLDGLSEPLAAAFRSALDPDAQRRISYDDLVDATRQPDTYHPAVLSLLPATQVNTQAGETETDGTGVVQPDETRSGNPDATRVGPPDLLGTQNAEANGAGHTEIIDSQGFADIPPTGYEWDDDVAGDRGEDVNAEPADDHTNVMAIPPTSLDPNPGPEEMPQSYPPTSSTTRNYAQEQANDGQTRVMSGEAAQPAPSYAPQHQYTPQHQAQPAYQNQPNYIANANYQPQGNYQMQPNQQGYKSEPWGAPHDYGDVRTSNNTPPWIFVPGKHRVFFFLIWIALALFGSAIPYWVVIFVAVALVITDAIGTSLDDIMTRRIRRGGRQRGEASRTILRLPLVLVLGIIKIAISALAGLLVGMAAAWALYFLAGLEVRIATAGGVALAVLTMWVLGTSAKARLGANAVMQTVTPSTGYRIFWIIVAAVVVLGALVYAMNGTWVDWAPLNIGLKL